MNTLKDSNVLIILGNGHNLALGLRSNYRDFGKRYIKSMGKFSNSRLCNELIRLYNLEPTLWNDFEKQIKEFALSYNPIKDNAIIEYELFEWLRYNLGWYMDGEAKYWFLINPSIKNNSYYNKFANSLPYIMLKDIICNNYKFDILSFNYTWLELLINNITCDVFNIPRTSIHYNYLAEKLYENKFNIKYAHLSGNRCVLGIDDDVRIHRDISFLKKSHQLKSSSNYPQNMQHYKSIMIYGHSFGETDNDFIKFLFSNMMNNSVENNPKFYFITLDSKSKTELNFNCQCNTGESQS